MCCDDCEKAICQNCLIRICGDDRVADLDDSSPWQCFCCDPGPLNKYSLQKKRIMLWFEEDARSKKIAKSQTSASKSKPEKKQHKRVIPPRLTPKSREFLNSSSDDSDFDMTASHIGSNATVFQKYTGHSPASSTHSATGKRRTHSASSMKSSGKSRTSSTQSSNGHKTHSPVGSGSGSNSKIHSSAPVRNSHSPTLLTSLSESDDFEAQDNSSQTLKGSQRQLLSSRTLSSQSREKDGRRQKEQWPSNRSVKQERKTGGGKRSNGRRVESKSSVKADKGSSSGRVRKKLLSTSDSEELDIDRTMLTITCEDSSCEIP